MIFPKDKDVGEICQTLANGVKIHVSSYLFFTPPTFIEERLLVVDSVMAGSGVWQDCQSMPTPTLHQRIEPHVGKKNDHGFAVDPSRRHFLPP